MLPQLTATLVEGVELFAELAGELAERAHAHLDQLELPLHELDRAVDDARALGVGRGVRPLVAEGSPCLLGLDESDQLFEREPEEVAEAGELAQPFDVCVGVAAVLSLGAIGVEGKEAELFPVANRARRESDELRDLADPVRTLLRPRAQAASSTASRAAPSSTW